jgi:hypothetical protein
MVEQTAGHVLEELRLTVARATSIAPSSELTKSEATDSGEPSNSSAPSSLPASRTRESQTSFSAKNLATPSRMGWQRGDVGRQHPAQAHAVLAQHLGVSSM